MAHAFRSGQNQEANGRHSPAHLSTLAVRSLGQIYDMNLAAARVLMQTQARAASALGLPDWSGWFESIDERARRVFATGAEQFTNAAQRATEAANELQREVGRVVDSQTATVAQTLQHGLQALGTQTAEGLDRLVETAHEQAEEAQRTAAEVGERMRQGIEEGEEQIRRGREDAVRAVERVGEEEQGEGETARPRRRRA
ncbi:MAG TPA: hypothetical protein VF169_00100 [Albitalea sp.]|uniref:hypothetical protein n=1 Tax=Piscinibacter sp. TaxID=1903157 RepID=UPI002ED2F806